LSDIVVESLSIIYLQFVNISVVDQVFVILNLPVESIGNILSYLKFISFDWPIYCELTSNTLEILIAVFNDLFG
jgi:hypothetical protein